jgi:hypothetical protein
MKIRQGNWWAELVDHDHSTVHLGHTEFQCTNDNDNHLKIMLIFSALIVNPDGSW